MGAEGTGVDGVTATAGKSTTVNRDELLSLRVVAGSKRIFLALCENDRGRFLKISDGRSKLIVPGPGIKNLHAAIDALKQAHEQMPPLEPSGDAAANGAGAVQNGGQVDPLASERFISEGRKFYLDLLENNRGRYVKMSQATTRRISMTFPATGLPLLWQAMERLHELAPPDTNVTDPSSVQRITRTVDRQTSSQSGATVVVKAVQRELRIESKRIVFESGANRRGSYMRISETNGAMKMSVTIPHSAIPLVIDLLNEVQQAGDPADALRAAEEEAVAAAGHDGEASRD